MRILVTGGTGVIGHATVTALVQRGNVVHLLSRHARRDAEQWAQGVKPIVANVADAKSLSGSADGCDTVLHLSGIVQESGDNTFGRVNVEGTRNIVREAERAGVKRFIYVSSLGADSGESDYHKSKRQAEAITRQFSRDWTIIRPANVYGPGDEQISLLLRMVRTLPVLPIIGDGDQQFQPIWHEDLAELLARTVERDDLAGKELDVAGGDVTSQNDLIRRLSAITDREPPRVPVPTLLAELGMKAVSAIGMEPMFNESQIRMLSEGNLIQKGKPNAMVSVFDMKPTPLDRGLQLLADAQEEQLPDQGIGSLRRKRFWADIDGSRFGAEQLMEYVRAHFDELMADLIDTHSEPGVRNKIELDATITLSLPLRGHVQVRVAESDPRVFTLVALAGHPLAGAVRFLGEPRGNAVRFEVQLFERAATVIDLVMMRTLGEMLQDKAWREMIENVIRESGGRTEKIESYAESLDDDQADRVEEWLRDIVMERKREQAGI